MIFYLSFLSLIQSEIKKPECPNRIKVLGTLLNNRGSQLKYHAGQNNFLARSRAETYMFVNTRKMYF